MTRKDFEIIAEAIAECEEIIERNTGDTDAIYGLQLLVKKLSPRLALTNSRFDPARFEIAALPRNARRKRDAITTKLGMEAA